MTADEFKKRFKRGQIIVGWSTGLPMKITAIGDKRFLFVCPTSPNWGERVCAITNANYKWRKWDPKRYPDKHYEWILWKKRSRK